HHNARVDPAAEIGDHGNVSPQSFFDRLLQHRFKTVDHCLCIVAWVFITLVWEVHFPVHTLLDLAALSRLACPDGEKMARRKKLYPRKAGSGSRECKERENVIETARVRSWSYQSGRQQRFDFRREQKPFTAGSLLPRPIERADSEAISGQCQPPLVL